MRSLLGRHHRAGGFLLAWERLLWSGRRGRWPGLRGLEERYYLTDFRVVRRSPSGMTLQELALHEIGAVDLRQTGLQRLRGTSTLTLWPRHKSVPLRLVDVRRGPQLALIIQMLSGDGLGADVDERFVARALADDAADPFRPGSAIVTVAALLFSAAALTVVALARPSHDPPLHYRADDAIVPGGHKKSRADIVALMERDVMPFARHTLGPLVGGEDRVSCATCHGRDGEMRGWTMPAVDALPEPDVRMAGLERGTEPLDPQIRNAIYGYLADGDKQGTAAYMRGVVLPGMARLLHRPPYDFTRTYDYNRARVAVGCYHCHEVR